MLDRQDDSELIAGIERGDESAFNALYFRYRDWVHRLAWRFTRDEQLAEDILQETFAYLLGKFPGFQLTAKMTTFLYPVVKNLSIAARRKRERLSGGADALFDLPAPAGEDPTAASELMLALSALPEAQRETLLMRFVDGMELQEIAKALEIPLGTVKSRLHNALAALRNDNRAKEFFGQ